MKHVTKYSESAQRTLGTCYENGTGTAVNETRTAENVTFAARRRKSSPT